KVWEFVRHSVGSKIMADYAGCALSYVDHFKIYPPRVGVRLPTSWYVGSTMNPNAADNEFWTQYSIQRPVCNISTSACLIGLLGNRQQGYKDSQGCRSVGPSEEAEPTWKVPLGVFCAFVGLFCMSRWGDKPLVNFGSFFLTLFGGVLILSGYVNCS